MDSTVNDDHIDPWDRDDEAQERPAPPKRKPTPIQRLGYWIARRRIYMEIFLLILVLITIFMYDRIFISIQSGELGVLWLRFGGTVVEEPPLQEGLHIVWPFNRVHIYDTRVQQELHEFHVLSSDGLRITITMSIRYYPHRDERLNELHKKIGPDYLEKIIVPEIESSLRTIVGKYTPAELYQADYSLIESAISESLMQLTENFVVLDDLMITEIELPAMVQEAIQSKLIEQHNAEKYEYLLLQAQEEAKRKVILATGIRDFQDIVGEGISTQLLQWRGIEATLELAKSPNAKVVVIGNSRDGLPLIFDTSDMLGPNAGGAVGEAAVADPTVSASSYLNDSAMMGLTSSFSSMFNRSSSTFERMGSEGMN